MPECPVCIREYVSHISQRCPRVMMCGHTLCSVCIRKLSTTKKTVSCPSCREVSRVPCKGFPTNFALVEALQESEAKKEIFSRKRTGYRSPAHQRVPLSAIRAQRQQPPVIRSKKPPQHLSFSSSRCRSLSAAHQIGGSCVYSPSP